jgi:hypothetical protein
MNVYVSGHNSVDVSSLGSTKSHPNFSEKKDLVGGMAQLWCMVEKPLMTLHEVLGMDKEMSRLLCNYGNGWLFVHREGCKP